MLSLTPVGAQPSSITITPDAGIALDSNVPSNASTSTDAGSGSALPSTPEELLIWYRSQAEDARHRLGELQGQITTFKALDEDTLFLPPELESLVPCAPLDTPALASFCLTRLIAQHRDLQIAIRERQERESTLSAAWKPIGTPARRRRTKPSISPEQEQLSDARLEHISLERQTLEKRAALTYAIQTFIERTNATRIAVYEEQSARQRQLAEEAKRAEEQKQRAEAARRRALLEKDRANSLAESKIKAEDARLSGVEAQQARFRQRLVEYDKEYANAQVRFDSLLAELREQPDADQRYRRVVATLLPLQQRALGAELDVWRPPDHAPHPGNYLSARIRDLSDEFATDTRRLRTHRQQLADEAAKLDRALVQRTDDSQSLFFEQTSELARMRVDLFAQLSASERQRILDYRERTLASLESDADQMAIIVLHWLNQRYSQLSDVTRVFTDMSILWHVLWWSLEILLALLFLRYTLRRWNTWMLACTEVIGTHLHVGGWTLFLIRLADLARSFGPPLLVLFTAMFIHDQLGGYHAPAEIQILYIIIFWATVLRFQFNLVDGVTRRIGARVAEQQARDEYDNQDSLYDNASSSEDSDSRDADSTQANAATVNIASNEENHTRPAEPSFSLFIRCWRALTRYASVVLILLSLIDLAVGETVTYAVVKTVAWWGAVPLSLYFLRVWRPWIVRTYLSRSTENSWLTRVTKRHAERFYGIFVVIIALVIVLMRRVGSFVKDNLSDMDATKRMLAFMFRRQVEKHALEHGRMLLKPHELPTDIIEQFPFGPMMTEERPVKAPFLEEIKQAFDNWKNEAIDGSVVLVGGAGMGKSTALQLMSVILDEPAPVASVKDKFTDPKTLISSLARILQLPSNPSSEAAFIAELDKHLTANSRRVVVLDDCHNFFLRKVGGFTAWDSFTRIVNQSCDRIFWVMSFNEASWDYLRNISDGVSYFRRTVRIPPWTDEELRRLILTRMRRAKYRVNFTDLLVTRLQSVKATTQIIRTSRGYFRLLWDFTDGNPRIASYFWLRSLVPHPDSRRVNVHLFRAPRIEDLEGLPDDIAFVLAALVEHENITAEELATVSNTSPEFTRFALQYCREHGYMWRNDQTGRTKLSTQWQQPIIRYLKRRHLLYS